MTWLNFSRFSSLAPSYAQGSIRHRERIMACEDLAKGCKHWLRMRYTCSERSFVQLTMWNRDPRRSPRYEVSLRSLAGYLQWPFTPLLPSSSDTLLLVGNLTRNIMWQGIFDFFQECLSSRFFFNSGHLLIDVKLHNFPVTFWLHTGHFRGVFEQYKSSSLYRPSGRSI